MLTGLAPGVGCPGPHEVSIQKVSPTGASVLPLALQHGKRALRVSPTPKTLERAGFLNHLFFAFCSGHPIPLSVSSPRPVEGGRALFLFITPIKPGAR